MNPVEKRNRVVDVAADPFARYHTCKAMARGYAETYESDRTRLAQARAFCALVLESFWKEQCKRHGSKLKIAQSKLSFPQVSIDAQGIAETTGSLISAFPVQDAGFLIGSIYTVMLPPSLRSQLGAYYTPPPLVARLLDMAGAAGFDFANGSAIDPACGGGAFLAPLALRMLAESGQAEPAWILGRLEKRLKGLEIDPFAAWMTTVLLEAAVLPLCVSAKRRLTNVVEVCDSLRPRKTMSTYDLVIGNPPYGRVTLDPIRRRHYARSVYGHANLYGLFTDLALQRVKEGGLIAYLTPTSFLGGQYFKSLRELLATEATPNAFDFVSDRDGVFDDVLQETLLATYVKESREEDATVSVIVPRGIDDSRVERLGTAKIPTAGQPWLLPRQSADVEFIKRLALMPTRLGALGYNVSTGPLVWNRHKDQLHETAGTNRFPLIWAESVTQSGFAFSFDRRNHVPYIELEEKQPHLLLRKECVLLQRTTSKEQERRLLAAVLPQDFIAKHGGVVVENHLNLIYANDTAKIKPSTVAAILNTKALDRAFRCISGSVAVSAYEINALPFPDESQLLELEELIATDHRTAVIEKRVAELYGVN